MFETIDWTAVLWTAAVFLSGYLIGRRKRTELESPLDFDVGTISPAARIEIESAMQRGSKIEAIRALREDTGLGLKDSKSVIDRWNSFAPPN